MSRGVGRYEQLKAENQNIVFILSSKPSAKLCTTGKRYGADGYCRRRIN
jgi:hypothetical protein